MATPDEPEQPPRPPVPSDGLCYFWGLDTERWVPCECDDPRGVAGEGLENPGPGPDPDPFAKT